MSQFFFLLPLIDFLADSIYDLRSSEIRNPLIFEEVS